MDDLFAHLPVLKIHVAARCTHRFPLTLVTLTAVLCSETTAYCNIAIWQYGNMAIFTIVGKARPSSYVQIMCLREVH